MSIIPVHLDYKPTLTIAGKNHEFVLVSEIVLLNIREGGDDLVLGGQLGALLELKVTNSARKSEVTIDSTEIDEATCGGDSILLI